MAAPTQEKTLLFWWWTQKALKNSSLGGSCFNWSYVMANSVTTFKVKVEEEASWTVWQCRRGARRCVQESVTMYHLTRRSISEDLICINSSVRTSNNIAVPVCSFCVLLISLFHSYRHCTRHPGQFLTLQQWPTFAQHLICVRHDGLSPWSAVPVHSLDPASTHMLYDVCHP